jgi:imidazole glycerol-phosphate synthase subunit HisH
MTGSVTIIDYGVGNIASIANMLRKGDFASELTGDHERIATAEKILLPGVGAFDTAALRLRETGLRDLIIERAAAGVAILGVCLGMQLLLDASEEGVEPGLGLIPGKVRRFPRTVGVESLRVPHMGWNTVHREHHPLVLPHVDDDDRFYFVHSYYADPTDQNDVLATTTHGVTFASMIHRGNVTGVQFHPEKSHRMGLKLLSDFARA